MNLQEARKRIPELDGLSDDAALSVIQQVYYPDIDRATLASRLGVKVAAPPAPERTWGQAIGDTAVQMAEGVNTTLGAVPSIVAPDGSMAGFFRDNAGYWRDKQSDVLKGRIAATDQRIQEAGKEGVMSQIGTAVSEYWNDPAQAARLVATNLPSMAATLGTGALAGAAAKGVAAARGIGAAGEAALAAQYGTRTAMATNAALNAGGARSEAYEDLKRAALAQGMSSEQAEQAALDGSVMPGVVGGVAGAVSGKLGLEKALLGQPGAVAGSALRRAAGSFGAELAGEQIEEVAPKITTNYEAGKIDPARSLTDDIGRTMVETAIGAGPGAIVAGGVEGLTSPAKEAADAIRATEKVPESGALTKAVNAGVEAKALAVESGAPLLVENAPPPALGERLTDTDMGAMLGGGGMAGRADPLAVALGMNNEAQANSITNVANVAERRPPMPASDAARMLDEARNRGLDLAVAEHPAGGFVLVPPNWVTPDMAAQGEARLKETIARMQQADAAPVERAPRTRTDGVGLNLQTDPVQNYLDNLRSVNTPAARAYVRDFDAGRITPADVQRRMQAEQGLTPDQRIARAAAEAPAQTDTVADRLARASAQGMATPAPTDILNPAGEPFKTRMAADRAAKKTPGAVVPVEGGFVVRPQEPVNVQDVPQAPQVPQAAPAISQPGQAPQVVGAQPAGPAAGVPTEGAGAVEAAGVKPAGQRQLSADEQAAQDREEARAKEPSLPPVLSARLQEAHKAHGRDVKRSVVERSIANEKANNTGTPKAKRERADRIARLEADLALFDEAAAMPPKEAAGVGGANSAAAAPAPQTGPIRLGRNNTPLSEGGKPFKTRKAAGDAKKLQPMMRVVTVPGGYALAEKTPAQLAAEERASRRLRNPNTSARGEPIPAHAFIAAAGGLNRVAASDMGVDGNPRIGNRTLFAGQGRGLSMDQATQMLIQDGYLSEGATINDALSLIKTSLTRPQYNADGIERIAQAEADAQFEDYLAAQEDAAVENDEFDPFGPAPTALDEFSDDMLESSGYDAATDAIKAEVRALLEMANAQGIDTESIMLEAHEQTRNATEQDYYEAAKSALEAAITGSNRDRGTPAGSEGQGPGAAATSAAEQGLNQPVALNQQAQAATENVAPAVSTTVEMPPTRRQESSPFARFATGRYRIAIRDEGNGPYAEVVAIQRGSGVEIEMRMPGEALDHPAFSQLNARAQALFETPTAGMFDAEPPALELAAQTPAEAAVRQDAQEQADKAEAAAKRAADVAAAKEDDRKRIAQASVRAADNFELGQDPMDSLTGQGGLMFSRAAATEVRNLVTLHNLTDENLRYADSMGGIPVPSIGITKVESPFGGFGNITLIAPKGMIDPKAGVPVYDRDAWTARFPTMNFKKVKASKADALYERIKGVRDLVQDDDGFVSQLWEQIRNASVQTPDKVTSLFTRYAAPRALYAQQVLGKTVKVPTRAVTRTTYPIGHDKELIAYWKKNGARFNAVERETSGAEFSKTPEAKGFDDAVKAAIARYADKTGIPEFEAEGIAQMMPDGGVGAGVRDRLIRDFDTFGKKEVDRAALVQAIDRLIKRDDAGYLRWVEGLVKPLFDEPTITLRGREVAPTLDNIVDAMTVGATAGAEKSMTFSPGKVAAMLGKQFKSLDEIKAARDQVVSPQDEAEGKKSSDALLAAYRSHVSQFYTGKDWRGDIDTWAANDDAMEALAKAGKVALSDANIRAAMTRMGFKGVDQQALDMARDAIDALRNAATDYFEAKPQRAVKLNEFKGAVVPKGTNPEAIAILEKHGIAVELYSKTEGAREKAIQKLAKRLDKESGGVLFSFAGEKAETSNLMDLATAQDRLSAGEDAETVRQETGWFQGNDGKWRFEISDADARLKDRAQWTAKIDGINAKLDAALQAKWQAKEQRNDFLRARGESPSRISSETKKTPEFKALAKALKNAEAAAEKAQDAAFLVRQGDSLITVGDVLSHPALFAAYPGIANVRVDINDSLPAGNAAYAYELRAIELSGKSDAQQLLSTLLHEIQHGIQHIEGFAMGGSPNEFRDESADAEMLRDGAILAVMMRSQGTIEKAKALFVQRFKRDPAFGSESAALSGESPESMRARADNALAPHERYRRLAGEVEARNTQARQGMTDEQRRVTSPGSTADVADADVIVVFNGKEMANAPMPANAAPDAATTAQPLRTPAATIRAAITKAYGKLLGQLESKGLVTLTQTEDEAIEAAAQARAAKTGQSVEQARSTLRASVKNSVADQTQTEAFKRWFAGSRVVDANGRPLVVYHGTNVGINEFKPAKGLRSAGGLFESSATSPFKFFSPDKEEAQSYANAKGGHLVFSVYLRMERPLDSTTPDGLVRMHRLFGSLDDTELSDWADSAVDLLDGIDELRATTPAEKSYFIKRDAKGRVIGQRATEREGYILEKYTAEDHAAEIERDLAQLVVEYEALLSAVPSSDAPLSVWAALDEPDSGDRLRAAGFDGLVFHENDGKKTFAVLDSTQIKSATGNNGDFDPANPDIRRSADGSIQGFFDPQTGQSFLIADNLSAEAAPGVLMHEVGIHMAADGSMKALFNRAAMMLKLQGGNPFMKAVQARMDAAGETSGEEAAAYIAEAYENDRANAPASVQRWLADLLAAVKAWMFKKGIMGATAAMSATVRRSAPMMPFLNIHALTAASKSASQRCTDAGALARSFS